MLDSYQNSFSCFAEQLRISTDLIYLFFLIGDQTDIKSGPVVRELVDMMIDMLNNLDK